MKFENKVDLTKWALASERLWLFLDYDGTLVDYAPTPEVVETNPGVIHLLSRLAGISTIRVTVLSGRRLEHIRLLLPITGIFLAGTYGIELLTPAGEEIHRVEYGEIRPTLEAINPQWERIIAGRKGVNLEDKGWALALHTRFANEETSRQVLSQAQQVIDQNILADRFRILGGHKFLEIAPRLASKKETVAYLLHRYPLPNVHLLYIGDDDKDEEAFPLIHAKDGVAIKVLQPSQLAYPTEADLFFESPQETLQWLEKLI